MTEVASPRTLLWLGAGFGTWFVALVALYAIHAIGCAFAWPTGPLRLGLGVVLVSFIVVLVIVRQHLAARRAAVSADGTADFLVALSVWSTMAAVATTVFTLGVPTLLVAACS